VGVLVGAPGVGVRVGVLLGPPGVAVRVGVLLGTDAVAVRVGVLLGTATVGDGTGAPPTCTVPYMENRDFTSLSHHVGALGGNTPYGYAVQARWLLSGHDTMSAMRNLVPMLFVWARIQYRAMPTLGPLAMGRVTQPVTAVASADSASFVPGPPRLLVLYSARRIFEFGAATPTYADRLTSLPGTKFWKRLPFR
jgi:hypothetical protein